MTFWIIWQTYSTKAQRDHVVRRIKEDVSIQYVLYILLIVHFHKTALFHVHIKNIWSPWEKLQIGKNKRTLLLQASTVVSSDRCSILATLKSLDISVFGIILNPRTWNKLCTWPRRSILIVDTYNYMFLLTKALKCKFVCSAGIASW